MTRTKHGERRVAFVLRYFMENSQGLDGKGNYRSTLMEGTTTYDRGMDFSVAFREAFPTGRPDPTNKLGGYQLSIWLRRLSKDRWLERGILGNEQMLPYEPKWQYVYSVPQWLINELKSGRVTPEAAAHVWANYDRPKWMLAS